MIKYRHRSQTSQHRMMKFSGKEHRISIVRSSLRSSIVVILPFFLSIQRLNDQQEKVERKVGLFVMDRDLDGMNMNEAEKVPV